MSLLFDENLAPRLASLLKDLFPGSTSADDLGLRSASDEDLWSYAAGNRLAIVTRDADFVERSALRGHPPKIIWVTVGNCSTAQVESLIRWRAREIPDFLAAADAACLELR
jgi:predicted nuclease of predicted toxin-antitoxin system